MKRRAEPQELTDEMALDFAAWVERIASSWHLSAVQMARLTELDPGMLVEHGSAFIKSHIPS